MKLFNNYLTQKQKTLLFFILIGTLVFFAFLPSLFCDFTNWDDRWMLLDNPLIYKLNPKHIAGTIFGSIYSGVYQPFVFLSFAIENYFFGLNPFIYHLTNVLLHIAITFLVFIFINQLSGNKNAALIACLFWALNPLRVESVTWITERKDLLYALFYLLSLIKYVQYLKSGRKKIHLALSLTFFIFSCLSKLTAVSLSLIIVLLDYYYQRKFDIRAIAEKTIYFMISIVVGVFSIWAVTTQSNFVDGKLTEYLFSPIERVQLVSYSFINYFIKSVIPYNLSAWHPYQYPPGSLPKYYLFFLFITIAFLLVSGWYFIKFRNKKIIFGFLFFCSTVVFALQIFPVGNAAFADRNIYISCIAIAFLTGELYLFLIKKFSPKVVFALFTILILVYGFFTHQQTKVWQNSFTLWTDIIEKYPNDNLGYLNRGTAKFLQKNYSASIEDYELSLQRKKGDFTAMLDMAMSLKHLKNYELAMKWVEKSIAIYPNNSLAYFTRGEIFYDLNKFEDALGDFSKTIGLIRKDPFHTSLALTSRARVKIVLKEVSSAIEDLNHSIEFFPDNSDSWHFRGLCYYYQNNFTDAKNNFLTAMKINPKHDIANFYMGMTEVALGNLNNACEFFHQSSLLSYSDGKRMYLFYCGDPEIKKKMFFSNGKLKFQLLRGLNEKKDSVYHLCNFDSLGKMVQQGEFDLKSGKYNGEIQWYHQDGSLKKTGFSNDSVTYGQWREFYPDGTLRAEYSFLNGELDSDYRHFYPNGKLWTERQYQQGRLIKVIACLDRNGNSLKSGTFFNGNGSLNVFDENGKVILVQLYKDGLRVQ